MKRLKLNDCHPEPDTTFELTEVFAFPDPTLALFLDCTDEDSCEAINLNVEQAVQIRDWLNRWLDKVESGSGNEKYTGWINDSGEHVLCKGLFETQPGPDWMLSQHFIADDWEEAEEKFLKFRQRHRVGEFKEQ